MFARLKLHKANDEAGKDLEVVVETNAKKSSILAGMKRTRALDNQIRGLQEAGDDDDYEEEENNDEEVAGPTRKQKKPNQVSRCHSQMSKQ